MNNKDNVISMEEYKKRKSREAEDSEAFFEGMARLPEISRDYAQGVTCHRDAPHPTPEDMIRMFEDMPPLRFQVKSPQPKPWYHWYTEQR